MKRLFAITLTVILLFCLVACGSENNGSAVSSNPESASAAEQSSAASSEPVSSFVSAMPEDDIPAVDSPIRVAALKGPTAMGMVEIMEKDYGADIFEFTLVTSPDEITPLVAQGKIDIAAVPANLASVLYNKTEGKVSAISVNTLGVLYIVENGNSVKTVEDLKGKTIFASGKGAVPEYALNYMLTKNGIDPSSDVTIEYKSEHAECVSALTTTENAVAMLPQPFVTTAQMKNESINAVLDITAEWEKLADSEGNPSTLLTGATIARSEFIAEHPELVAFFIREHSKSVDTVNSDPKAASLLMEKYDIVPAAVAEKAIPECNIVCITGDAMKIQLSAYLGVLMDQNPQAVGGSLPDDQFFHTDFEG